jgi:hypothetical protein
MVRSIGFDVEPNGLEFVWFPGSVQYLVRHPSACKTRCDEDNKFYASRVHQNMIFFRNKFSVVPGVPAALEHDVGDVEVRTPPELAAEPVVARDILSAEPAADPGVDLGDRSSIQRGSSRRSATNASRINCMCQGRCCIY